MNVPFSAYTRDDVLFDLEQQEIARVQDTIQLIASENFASPQVLEMVGSVFSNKYAEGYPGKRYYEGDEIVDQVETLAIERAKKIFHMPYANVQLLSGGPANMAAYEAILEPGDTVLSMDLAQGGHLTHGSPVNFSGKKYHFVHYPVDPITHRIDMEVVRQKAIEVKPKLIVCGASAYPRTIDFSAFRAIADEVGALLLADISHIAGLIVGGVHPSPAGYAHIITTTTHKTLRGPRGAIILADEQFGDAINKAVFPAIQAGPHMNTIAAKAVAFYEADQLAFREYAMQVVKNASVLADELKVRGYELTTGGTDNHLMVINLTNKDITGKVASKALAQAGIVANKNMIPYDVKSPFVTSGVRIGTPAMTTRGLKEDGMKQIAAWIDRVLGDVENQDIQMQVRSEIVGYLKQFPLY